MRRTPETATDPLNRRVPADAARAQATYRFGFWIALVTSVLTVITFALALTAIPNDVPYPFTSDVIVEQWPGDYLWMYLVASVHEYALPARKVYSLLGLCVAIVAAGVLLIDYF